MFKAKKQTRTAGKMAVMVAAIVLAVSLSMVSVHAQRPSDPVLLEKHAQAEKIFQEANELRQLGTDESLRSAALKFTQAADLFAETESRTEQAYSIMVAGAVRQLIGEKEGALRDFNKALGLFRGDKDGKGEAMSLEFIGSVYEDLRQTDKALECYESALSLRQRSDDEKTLAAVYAKVGRVYNSLGKKARAIENLEQALTIFKRTSQREQEATTLQFIGIIASAMGDKQKALSVLNDTLAIYKELKDEQEQAATLNLLGLVYLDLGENAKALELFNEALPVFKRLGERLKEAKVLNNIGMVFSSIGERRKALDFYNAALPVLTELKDVEGRASTLLNIGLLYSYLGEQRKALEFYDEALPLFRESQSPSGEIKVLNSIAVVYSDLGEKQRALQFYQQALDTLKTVEDPYLAAATVQNVGAIFVELKEYQKGLEFYEGALSIFSRVGNKNAEATTLNNIGTIHLLRGDSRIALDHFSKALMSFKQVGDKRMEAVALGNLMIGWSLTGNSGMAAFYGKQAVNVYQRLRADIGSLDKDIQKTYAGSIEGAYRRLADILAGDGRFAEAQQVLGMLKEEEFSGYVRRDAEEIKGLSARVDLRADEKAALERYEKLAGRVTELGAEFMKLEELKNRQGADFARMAEYDDLKSKLDAANAAFRIFLEKEIAAQFPRNVKKEIELDRALQGRLAQWGEGTVALYTILGEDRYRVILTTPKVQIDGKTDIKASELNAKIFKFREALKNPSVDPRPLGKELYDILIKPIEKDLAAAGAKTLVWSLDGALRYIPIATLSPDGATYLAESYRNVVVTSTIRQNLSSQTNGDWSVLGAGVTKESTVKDPLTGDPLRFDRLSGVDGELHSIVREGAETRGVLGGRRLLDDRFDASSLGGLMSERAGQRPRYNVVHLATHFRLGVDNSRSFLVLGGNRALTLADISDDSALDFTDVELVTLSACDTAFGTAVENRGGNAKGNGAEVDSLATFIELRGAKSVMASLWPVVDESTSLLMAAFYKLKKENPSMSKAEALQRAQLAMISGEIKPSGKEDGCRQRGFPSDSEGKDVKKFNCDQKAPFSHPNFWSPFVLIGNWR